MLSSCAWGEFDRDHCIGKDDIPQLDCGIVSGCSKERNYSHIYRKYKTQPLFLQSLDKLKAHEVYPYYSNLICEVNSNLWDKLPGSVHPCDPTTQLPIERHDRKVGQVENMLSLCIGIIDSIADIYPNKSLKIVEFCCGTGFIGLPLAALYPNHKIVLIDGKKASLDIAQDRVTAANLNNVEIVLDSIENYTDSFDLGIALHACGGASDISLEKCVASNAAYVICPCCIGKILFYRQWFMSSNYSQVLTRPEINCFVQASDFGHSDLHEYTEVNKLRRICKCYVEFDRMMYANDHGYSSYMKLMTPTSASPKNDMLFGIPSIISIQSTMRSIFDQANQLELDIIHDSMMNRFQHKPLSNKLNNLHNTLFCKEI